MRYTIFIEKDSSSDYGVTVPDLPGCFSAGSTIDEAITNNLHNRLIIIFQKYLFIIIIHKYLISKTEYSVFILFS